MVIYVFQLDIWTQFPTHTCELQLRATKQTATTNVKLAARRIWRPARGARLQTSEML